MEQFLVSLSTGGLVEGCYSTLDKAKAAVESHYHLIRGGRLDRSSDMAWLQLPTVPGYWHWSMINQLVFMSYPGLQRNSTPDGILENISITKLDVDSPLPVV